MPTGSSAVRSAYTDTEDTHLMEYIARFCPDKGRKGNKLYEGMVKNLTGQSAWAVSHSWQSWRDRYVRNSDYFDNRIRKFQKKHGLWKPGGTGDVVGEVNQDEEVKKRKRVSHISQEDVVALKKQRVMKKAVHKGKGKEVTVNEDPGLHLFVAFSKIPRKREKVDIDQSEGGGRHSIPSRSTADAPSKLSPPRQAPRVKSVDSRPGFNKRISAQEVRNSASISQAPRQQTPTSKSPSPAHHSGTQDVGDRAETDVGGESPLFTPPDWSLFTQPARNDDLREDGGSDEDDSMVNNLLIDPLKAKVDDEAVSRKPDGGESDEEYPHLHPLLHSPEQSSITSKSPRRPSINKTSCDNQSISTTQAGDPQPKTKSKQPLKYLEGPYRTQLVGSNPPKAGSDDPDSDSDSDAAQDLIPQASGKTRIKKPSTTQVKPSTSSLIRKRAISDGSSAFSSTSSTKTTPTPPRKRLRTVRVVSSSDYVDMETSRHDGNTEIQAEATTTMVQKSESDEEEEGGESATEVENADAVHPFDAPSQPPRTPRRARHPLDIPQSQMHSHSSIRSHVSERDMERVIKTLERFISKLDTDHRERFLEPRRPSEKGGTGRVEAGEEEDLDEQEEEEEGEEIGHDAMVLDVDDQKLQPKLYTAVFKGKEQQHAANLRERGSPLPVRNSKSVRKSIFPPAITESEVQSGCDLPPSSPLPIQSGESGDQDESMGVEEGRDGTPRSVLSDKRAAGPVASSPSRVEEPEPMVEETQLTHDSLFSSSETSETQRQFPKAEDKGKARAIDLPALLDEEDVRHRRHTVAMANEDGEPQALDLRRLARARSRSLPSSSSISTISLGHSAGQWAPSSSIRQAFDLKKPLRMRLSETDQTKLIEMNVERMALQYGFPESFVFGIWNDCGSLDEAETILSELGSKLEDLLDRSRKRRSSIGLDVTLPLSRTVTPQDTTRMESDLENKEQKSVPSTIQPRGRSTVSPSRPSQSKRNTPQFKPTLVDDHEIPESDYSPPIASRAGKFRRLSKQGRHQEALKRETRRASGGNRL